MKARTWLTAAVSALTVAGLGAGTALAGEVTGNGKKEDYSQGRSICSFSGQNDHPEGDPNEGPGGRTQSYGQDVRTGLLDPTDKSSPLRPGFLCNPNNLDLHAP